MRIKKIISILLAGVLAAVMMFTSMPFSVSATDYSGKIMENKTLENETENVDETEESYLIDIEKNSNDIDEILEESVTEEMKEEHSVEMSEIMDIEDTELESQLSEIIETKSQEIETENATIIDMGQNGIDKAEAELVSGQCGDNLTWTLEDGTLTISGTGVMNDYKYDFYSPWYSYSENIVDIIIEEGVTSIGDHAFGKQTYLENISLPSTLIRIGSGVFNECSKIKIIQIPQGVTTIGVREFYGCNNLEKVILPDSLIEVKCDISDWAWQFQGPFSQAELTSAGPIGSGCDIEYEWNDLIPASMFADSNIKQVIFPLSIQCIGNDAFCQCYDLENISLPDNLEEIGESAFAASGIKNIDWPNSLIRLGDQAFWSTDLEEIYLPEKMLEIGSGCFQNCQHLKKIVFPKSLSLLHQDSLRMMNDEINYMYFQGNIPSSLQYALAYDSYSYIYYPISGKGWKEFIEKTSEYAWNIKWMAYEDGTEPWNMTFSNGMPCIWVGMDTTPSSLSYNDVEYFPSSLDANFTLYYMQFDNPTTYENVGITIELPDGLSFEEDSVQKILTMQIGIMDNTEENRKVVLEPIKLYTDGHYVTDEFQIVVSVTADRCETAAKTTLKIPVDFEISKSDEGIVDAVKKYALQDESEVLQRIISSYSGDELIQKLYEFYNCDNVFDLRDKITECKDSHNERWSYMGLTSDEIYCSWQYYNYLNNTPKGIAARASLYASGLVFNGELGTWLNPGTYLDGDYPGIEKYKTLLENFIDTQNTSVPHYSYIKETQKFVKGAVGLCTDVEKTKLLKELDKSTDLVEAQTIFNDFIATKLPDGKKGEFIIVYEDKTLFSEAMGCTGKIFKIVNTTVDTIASFVDVSSNLDTYETYKSFLYDIYESQDLPWEMRIAAYQLIDEFTKEYYAPFEDILRQIRDACFDAALDATKMGNILNLNGYLTTLDFTAFCINKFVDIGSLVENSAYTEGYVILAMHYENKLNASKKRFLENETEQNAWEFYENYLMLWKLRVESEKQWLAMNKLGGILGDVISNSCSYADKETTIKDNLKLLESFKFKYDVDYGTVPKEYQYLQKVVVECPVTVDIYASDGTLICKLPDREETTVENRYGKFITKYRPTTGDYVKIGYLYNGESYTINMIGQDLGSVECSIVTTEDHQKCTIKGFDEIAVKEGTVINVALDNENYTVDQDGDGTIEIKASIVDKEKTYVQFVYGEGQQSLTTYVDDHGYIKMPEDPIQEGYTFGGWYTDTDGEGEKFDGSAIIQQNMTVYAYWIADDQDKIQLPAPLANVESGSRVEKGTKIIFSCEEAEADIYYTTDGSMPTKMSTVYVQPIEILEDITIKAFASKEGYEDSEIITWTYVVINSDVNEQLAALSANVESGIRVEKGTKIILSCEEAEADIYYTTDGSMPTKMSTKYMQPIEILEDITIKAFASKEGYLDSEIVTLIYMVTNSDNDQNDDEGDVLPEDIPVTGIPNGLWIAGVMDQTYTGKAIKPQVRVYDGSKRLKEGQDYTITYKNNVKANDASVLSKAPSIIVKGNGNYSGKETAAFKILPVSLSSSSVSKDNIIAAYNKKNQRPMPTILFNGKKLKNKTDYTLSYPDAGAGAYLSVGTYIVKAVGKGNFSGAVDIKFTITNSKLISKAKVSSIGTMVYQNGKSLTPEPIVKMGNYTLEKSKDYIISYKNNVEIGTASVLITGIGEYAGTKKVNFEIVGMSIKNASIEGLINHEYTGTSYIPDIKVSLNGTQLKKNINYTLTCTNNQNVGTVTVKIQGIKAYSGTIEKKFKLMPYNIGKDTGKLLKDKTGSITAKYTKGDTAPEPQLYFGTNSKKLVKGRDYTISYKNNKSVSSSGKTATMVIKGKGNFKGTITKTFTIISKSLTDAESPVALSVPDKVYSAKAGKYKSIPILTDVNGEKLKAGTDYEKDIVYTMPNGTELTALSKPEVGTTIKVKIIGKGAYMGSIEGSYQITEADFNKAKISIQPQVYTGKPIIPEQSAIIVKVGGISTPLVYGKDYEIVADSCKNNINKGTASVSIKGKGNYGGIKTVNFKITAKNMAWFYQLFG